jgi:hypothetical protein
MQVGIFGVDAIVQITNSLLKLIQQPCGAQNRSAGVLGLLMAVFF